MKPKVIVLRGPGTNCDVETARAFAEEGAKVEVVHSNTLRNKPSLLRDYSILCIPGGFTYGDDISAGRVLANEIEFFLKEALKEFIQQNKLILGICNGFQVMVKTGLLPDMDFIQKATLSRNDSLKFEARWVSLRVEKDSLWTKGMEQKIITLPVAHGEGKFVAEEALIQKLEKEGNVLLRYVDPKGGQAHYPYDPNGSMHCIAGIIDKTGRALGLMPHPERFFCETQHPYWHFLKSRREDVLPWGRLFFRNALAYVKQT